ncbi:MAG: hypothetical protein AAGL24_25555 [Pseudomonadota bacterium]
MNALSAQFDLSPSIARLRRVMPEACVRDIQFRGGRPLMSSIIANKFIKNSNLSLFLKASLKELVESYFVTAPRHPPACPGDPDHRAETGTPLDHPHKPGDDGEREAGKRISSPRSRSTPCRAKTAER